MNYLIGLFESVRDFIATGGDVLYFVAAALLLLGVYLKTRRFSGLVAFAFAAWVAQWTFVLADDLFGVLRNVAWLLFVQLTLGLLVLAVAQMSDGAGGQEGILQRIYGTE